MPAKGKHAILCSSINLKDARILGENQEFVRQMLSPTFGAPNPSQIGGAPEMHRLWGDA